MYHAQRWDAEAEYLGRVRMVLCSHIGSINFPDLANIRQVHEALMSQVRNEAIYISNKYKIQVEPIKLEWDKFLSTLEKDLPEILSCNNNQQQATKFKWKQQHTKWK